MRIFQPSRLDFSKADRSIQLQFTGVGFNLCLFERGHAVTRMLPVSAAQLRQVSIDMRPIQLPPLKFVYENRHVVVEYNEHAWARVPDVMFMRLLDFAAEGSGESIDCS